jgi:ribosomal protein S18 acetylase RimI-like enzyme
MNVRPAHVDDAGGIASIHVRVWQAAYRGIVPEPYLESLSIERRTIFWRSQILESSPTEIVVADSAQSLAGWASFGPSRDDDRRESIGELYAIYVLPELWGTGAGRGLWDRAKQRLIERGFQRVTLWVLRDNVRAIRFYEAAGFAPTTERAIEIGGKNLPEVRYEVPIG